MTGVLLSCGTPFSPWQAPQSCTCSSRVSARAATERAASIAIAIVRLVDLNIRPSLAPASPQEDGADPSPNGGPTGEGPERSEGGGAVAAVSQLAIDRTARSAAT